MGDRLLRLRFFISDWLVPVALTLLVLAAVGGWLTYSTHVDPGMETEEHVTTWSTSAGFEHGATVQNDTRVFEEGTRVTNRTIYYDTVMPELDGRFIYSHSGPAELETDIQLEYVVYGFEERDDGELRLWEERTPLATRNTTLTAGEQTTLGFEVDVNETIRRIETIQSELGGSRGATRATLRADVTGEGSIDGSPVEISETHRFNIQPTTPTYTVSDRSGNEQYREGHRELVQATYGPVRTVGSVGLFVGALIALVGLGVCHLREAIEPDSGQRELLTYRQTREEFDEWITTGSITPSLLERDQIAVDSLAGLVDVAIDSDQRVIEEATKQEYFVVDDGVLYIYERPHQQRLYSVSSRPENSDENRGSDVKSKPGQNGSEAQNHAEPESGDELVVGETEHDSGESSGP